MASVLRLLRRSCLGGVVLLLMLGTAGCDAPISFEDITMTSGNSYEAYGYRAYKDYDDNTLKVERDGAVLLSQPFEGAVRYTLFEGESYFLIMEDNYDTPNGERFDAYLADLATETIVLVRQDAVGLADPEMNYERHPDGSLVFKYMKHGHPTNHRELQVLRTYDLENIFVCRIIDPGSTEGDLNAAATASEVIISDENGYSTVCPLAPGEGRLELGTAEIDFGEVQQGQTETIGLTVANGGSGALSFTSEVTSDAGGVFALQPDSGSITPGDDVTLDVTFSPTMATSPGEVIGRIEFDHDGTSDNDSVSLVAQVTAAPPAMRVEPAQLPFEAVVPGETLSRQATVYNDGGEAFTFTLETEDPFRAERLDAGPVQPLGSAAVEVTFSPPCDSAAGNTTGELRVEADYGAEDVVLLDADVTERPQILATPASIDFGTITAGHAYSEIVRIQNPSSVPLRYSSVQSDNPLFRVTHQSNEVPPGDERFLGVLAEPSEDTPVGTYAGTLTIPHNDCATDPVRIPIQAEVRVDPAPHPVIAGVPSHVTFVGVFPGESQTSEFLVFNAGNLPLEFDLASSQAMFSISPAAGTLDPAESQQVGVTFAPPEGTEVGSQQGELTIEHNDPTKGALTVALEGVVEGSDWTTLHDAPDVWLNGIDASQDVRIDAVGGQPGLIVSSSDSGETWQRIVQDAGHHLNDVDVFDTTGLAVGAESLALRSGDGGASWTALQGIPADAVLSAVHLVDDQIGWVAGGEGTLLRTNDGGLTFSAQDCVDGAPLRDIDATDATHAWVVGAQGGLVCRTIDGGASWSHAFLAPNWSLQGVDFAGRSHGLAVGDSGLILRSEDGGESWERVPLENVFLYDGEPEDLQLNDVILMEAYGRAWAVGDDGMILFSYNGGRDWYQQRTGLANDLNAIVHDGTALWAAGRPGIILQRGRVAP